MNTVNILFNTPLEFELNIIKPLTGIVGLYFIFSEQLHVQYPFKSSRLLYIGMSEKRTNSIGSRLSGHFEGKSKNIGLFNYRKVTPLKFTYLNYELLKDIWELRIEDMESHFILDFVNNFGVYPICNNKVGFEVLKSDIKIKFNIDWEYFN